MAALEFLEAQLNTRVTEGAQASVYVPGRTKLYGHTGELTQNFTASVQTQKFEVVHGIRTAAEFLDVQNSFYVVLLTPYTGLRFKNWGDFKATLLNSRATFVDGSTTDLQLQRLHLFGGIEFLRNIYKPVASTVTVFRKRAGVTSAIGATVDYTTGIAVISGNAGGDVYSWTGEFDIPVTFTDDEWTAQMRSTGRQNIITASGSVALEELPRAQAVTS